MLYVITLAVLLTWMIILLWRKPLSWHSILTAYAVAVVSIDVVEVLLNLLLGLYKFPTRLVGDPMYGNQLGVIFADTLILPVAYIIFVVYAANHHPWKVTIPFTGGFVILERVYLQLGFLKYHHWSTWLSAAFYAIGFRVGAKLAAPISSYRPPVPYWARLVAVGYTAYMWIGAAFGYPVLRLYQFRTGLFADTMADDRFVDLASGLLLAGLTAAVVPRLPGRLKPLIFAMLAVIGSTFGYYCYFHGWLVYHHWNHFLMILRYAVPSLLLMLYDGWELSYERQRSAD